MATLITTLGPDTGVPANIAGNHFGILQPVKLQAGMLQTTGPKTVATFAVFLESNSLPQAWQGSFSDGITIGECGRVWEYGSIRVWESVQSHYGCTHCICDW